MQHSFPASTATEAARPEAGGEAHTLGGTAAYRHERRTSSATVVEERRSVPPSLPRRRVRLWRSETASRARSAHRAASSLQACDRLPLLGPPWSNCLRNCEEKKKKKQVKHSRLFKYTFSLRRAWLRPEQCFHPWRLRGATCGGGWTVSLIAAAASSPCVIDKRGSTLRRKWAGFATRAAAARVCRSATTTPLTRGRAYLRI